MPVWCGVNQGDLLGFLRRKGPLPEADARWLFQQLVFGLDYCHLKVGSCGAMVQCVCCIIFHRAAHLRTTACGANSLIGVVGDLVELIAHRGRWAQGHVHMVTRATKQTYAHIGSCCRKKAPVSLWHGVPMHNARPANALQGVVNRDLKPENLLLKLTPEASKRHRCAVLVVATTQ